MATIKQIDGKTIHRIQSGQVIVDLCSVVKELVENSIDAGASTIEARFKNHGLDLIEVLDNGSGISSANYDSIALKHHTSKLSSYDDIGSLETFGFRGEALASLCALSSLSVTTCVPEDVPKGTKLTFEASGKVKDTNVTAAERGTTVTVEKLFHNLPVRRRELERNIKREWQKVLALLNQYACIKTGLKFTVSHQPTKGNRFVLFSTKGNPTTKDNIINIFGAKTMAALVPLNLELEMRPTSLGSAIQAGVDAGSVTLDVKVVGHVSRPVHGEGRQTPDRQMFFVNGRPCGLPQFAKTFNEVYRSYNSSQSPFILADVRLDTHLYDVNVSPDKRTILLHDQNHLLESIRASLVGIFDSQDYTIPTSHPLKARTSRSSPAVASASRSPFEARTSRSRRLAESEEDSDEELASASGDEASRDFAASSNLKSASLSTPRTVTLSKSRNTLDKWVNAEQQPLGTEEQEREREADIDEAESSGEATSPGTLSQSLLNQPASLTKTDADKAPVVNTETIPERFPNVDSRLELRSTRLKLAMNLPPSESAAGDEDLLENEQTEPAIPAIRPIKPQGGTRMLSPSQRSPVKRPPAEPARIFIGTAAGNRFKTGAGGDERDGDSEDAEQDGGESVSESPSEDDQPSFGTSLSQRFAAGGNARSAVPNTRPKPLATTPIAENSKANLILESQARKLEDKLVHSSSESSEPDTRPVSRSPDGAEPVTNSPEIRTKTEQAHGESSGFRPQPFLSSSRRKDATVQLIHQISGGEEPIEAMMKSWVKTLPQEESLHIPPQRQQAEDITAKDAESKLSLIISKSDFGKMRVAGQFNLGFIIAVRPAENISDNPNAPAFDELFIIDQHASDEKYNFERLQRSTVVQSQRLVHPKQLDLTALEEEVVLENMEAIESNGFKIVVDIDGRTSVGSRCQLTSLPLSRESTFDLTDLEELIALLGEESSESSYIPRPSKVRKMFAMRACRSSVMIGKPLTRHQMYSLVGHMGELDKPWNCPHGRPTMRHLFRMNNWDETIWKDDMNRRPVASWAAYANRE